MGINTTKISLVNKKVTCEVNNCLNYPISLVIITLLLLSFQSVVITVKQNIEKKRIHINYCFNIKLIV